MFDTLVLVSGLGLCGWVCWFASLCSLVDAVVLLVFGICCGWRVVFLVCV